MKMKWTRMSAAAVALACLLAPASAGFAKQTPYAPVIDPARFVAVVDNPYFPLRPGTTLVYEGATRDGLEHFEDYVTRNTRAILGVTCIEVRNRAWLDGELIEETLDWYAQDVYGNVWYFGEFVINFEGGVPINNEGSWEAGVDGAMPGIMMLAHPRKGQAYRQEFYPGVAEDMARVLSLTGSACVPYRCFDRLLVTKDWTPLEPGHFEHKYYAAGIGLVMEVGLHGGQGRVGLVSISTD